MASFDLPWLSLLCHWLIRLWLSSWRQGRTTAFSIFSSASPLQSLTTSPHFPSIPPSVLMADVSLDFRGLPAALSAGLVPSACRPETLGESPAAGRCLGPPQSGLRSRLDPLPCAFPRMCLLCAQLGSLSPLVARARWGSLLLVSACRPPPLPQDRFPTPRRKRRGLFPAALPRRCTQLGAVITG